MAKRPAWSIKNDKVICREFDFKWNSGFSIIQKQKNIANLHESIIEKTKESVLEISSKGLVPLGKNIGAFCLKYHQAIQTKYLHQMIRLPVNSLQRL